MSYFFVALILISIITAIFTGRIAELSSASLSEAGRAITIALSLSGTICLWSGLMRVAEKSGLVKLIARVLSPITGRIFKGIDKDSTAMGLITMNVTANLLGLGNAATPLGIRAMKALAEKERPNLGTATDNMIKLVVINTASIQIIPTTVAGLRAVYGSRSPMDIIFAVWAVSAVALIAGLGVCAVCGARGKTL